MCTSKMEVLVRRTTRWLSVPLALYLTSSLVLDRPLGEIRTNYLHWSSSLPAVSLCQIPVTTQSSNALNRFMNNLMWPLDSHCPSCSNTTNFPLNGYRKIVSQRRKGCRKLLRDCKWNGQRIDCCTIFKPLATRRGNCFAANSYLTSSSFKMEVSHYSKESAFTFSATEDIQVFLHGPKDLPEEVETGGRIAAGECLDVLYRSRQSVSEDSAWLASPESRGCLLEGEETDAMMELSVPAVYSQSLCHLHCLAAAQARLCRCQHHLLPLRGDVPDCDLHGLMCLDRRLGKAKEKRLLKKCDCLPTCDDVEVNIVWSNISKVNDEGRHVSLVLTTPPTEKVFLSGRYDLKDFLVIFALITRILTSVTIPDLLMNIFVDERRIAKFMIPFYHTNELY